MATEADILARFAKHLECVLQEHLVSTSELLDKHLSEYEARLKAASQHWCELGNYQTLSTNTNARHPGTHEIPEMVSTTDSVRTIGEPQVTLSTGGMPSTETKVESPKPPLCNLQTHASLASDMKTLTYRDSDEKKREKAKKMSSEKAARKAVRKSTSASWNLRGKLRTLEAHPCFEKFFMTLIAGNMLVVILQLEVARFEHKPMDELSKFQLVHNVFTFLFVIELATRICARGRAFFLSNPNWGWDYFDLVIVSSSLMEPMLHLLFNHNSQQSSTLRIIRVMRLVARASRLVRMFRLAKGFAPLRIMLASLLCCLKSLVWVVILMLFTMTVFAILFASSVMDYLLTKEKDGNSLTTQDLELQASYGSLVSCLLTQYMAIAGGQDWGDTALLLEIVHPLWLIMFLIFHVFFFLAFLNVVTGVFCQGAIEGAAHDNTIVIENQMEYAERYAHRLKGLFKDMDADGSGSITIDELEHNLQDQAVKAYFASLDIDPSDTWTLFSLLDADGKDEIELEDFIIGCLRLKGSAKAVDMVRVGYENQHMSKQIQNIEKQVLICQRLIRGLVELKSMWETHLPKTFEVTSGNMEFSRAHSPVGSDKPHPLLAL